MAKKNEETKPPKRTRFGSVDQLKSGQWRARYSHKGKRYTARKTWTEKKYAQRWIDREAELIDLGTWSDPDLRAAKDAALEVTINQAVDQWISNIGHLAQSSRDLYQSIRRNRIEPYLSKATLGDFTPQQAVAWMDTLHSKHGGKTKRNADAYKLLHVVLEKQVDLGTIPVNPCRVKDATKVNGTTEKVVPTPEQLQTIVTNMPEHLRAGTQVAAWCGLRPAEWQELRRSDVVRTKRKGQSDRVQLRIDRQAHKKVGKWYVTLPKGGKTRTVILPDHLVPVLDEQLEKFAQAGRDGLLFPNIDGEQLTRQKYYNAFKIRAEQAGCPKASPHSLRHYAGTAYAQVGATVKETMDYLGHSSERVAMQYQHTAQSRPDHLAAAMAALASQHAATGTDTTEQDTND